jgi:regulator of protease activity HflC (stomatin/prohibitin superfamily)
MMFRLWYNAVLSLEGILSKAWGRRIMGLLSYHIQIWEYERGLLYQKGRFVQVLEPGRYRLWRWEHKNIHKVSLRQASQTINGQEVLTTDKVPVRVTLIAQYAVHDPVLAIHSIENYVERLYQDLQLSLREAISSHSLDELLAERETLSATLLTATAESAASYGVKVQRVGVKDIILPGNVQRVFLQEIEADRAGRAALIAARHETAAARARANTAKLMDENPTIQRLQELEALVTLAGKDGNVLIVPGLENLLAKK